jgi:hypothetical protein
MVLRCEEFIPGVTVTVGHAGAVPDQVLGAVHKRAAVRGIKSLFRLSYFRDWAMKSNEAREHILYFDVAFEHPDGLFDLLLSCDGGQRRSRAPDSRV